MRLLLLTREITGTKTTLVVAIDDGELIASVEVRCGALVASVRALFVKPARRRCGLATELMTTCFAVARKAGCESVALVCNRDNKLALLLYKKLGFIPCVEDDEEFGMVRALT